MNTCYPLMIGGGWTGAASGLTETVTSPWDGPVADVRASAELVPGVLGR